MAQTRVLITVKTYPTLSEKYDELVCTAGFREDGSWIRIYPIPFRKLDYQNQYHKWQWINIDITKNTSDFRPESFRPVDIDKPFIVGETVGTEDDWKTRKSIAMNNVYTNMSVLIQKAKDDKDGTSLAIVKPSKVIDFIWEPCEREWDTKKMSVIEANQSQQSLFEDVKRLFKVVAKLPYKFSYVFTTEDGVESALDKVKIIEDLGYDNLVVSIKSSDVMMCVKAHELIAKQTNHPLHVGITESGTIFSGSIKSSIGLGLILNQGIGDTIRVSLTDDPVREIEAAKLILKTLGLRKGGIEVVSCPTCGRTRINLIDLAGKVEKMVSGYDLDLKLAVMGCVVNGPGEAKEADLGIAGGNGCGVLIKHGEIIKKVPEEELLDTLRYELDNWNE